jgi:flagellar hook protein FlgE
MYNFTPTPTAGSNGSLICYTNALGGTETVNLFVNNSVTPTLNCKGSGYFSDPTNATILMTESPITFNSAGADPMTLSLDRTEITQASASGSSLTVEQNGYAMGTLSSYSFDSSGIMTGTFSNGQKKKLAQLALANFTNPGGLNKVSDTLFEKSNNSGEPSIGTTNSGGRGKITPSSLEMSNVDLAQQFSDMIVTQRGYQANSKIITTSDTMLEELVNLKR